MPSKKYLVLPLFSLLLLFGGVGWHKYFKTQFQEIQLTRSVSKNVEAAIQKLDTQASRIVETLSKRVKINPLPDAFYLLDSGTVHAWGSNKFVPDPALLQDSFVVKYLKNHRGDYLIKKWTLDSGRLLVGVIPLLEQYKVVNKYLQPNWNRLIFPVDGLIITDISSPNGNLVCGQGSACYFKIKISDSGITYPTDYTTVSFFTLGILALVLWIVLLVLRLHQKGKIEIAFLIGLIFIFGIRILTIRLGFPMQWGNLTLFDPQQFASSSFNTSLGDFVINAFLVLIACFYVFRNYNRFSFLKSLFFSTDITKTLAVVFLLTLALFSFLYPYLFFEIISHNSSIQLDITQQVNFDGNRFWAFVAIAFGVLSSFLFCYVLLRLAIEFTDKSHLRFFGSLAFASLLFQGYCLLENHDYSITLVVSLFYFLLVYLLRLYRSFYKVSFTTFLYLLVSISAYSAQGGLCVRKFSMETTASAHLRFGNSSLVGQDILGEYLLSEAIQKIETDPFIISRFANPFLPKGVVRQRVQQIYLSSYFDRYATKVFLFNSLGEGIGNAMIGTLAGSLTALQVGSIKTEYKGVYRLTGSSGSSARRYMGIVKMVKEKNVIGFVVLDLSLKNILPQNVYPELLVDNRFSQFVSAKDFSYAFYSNGQLVNSFGSFNYRKAFTKEWLSSQAVFKEGLFEGGFIHNGIAGDDGEVAIVSSASFPLIATLANVAFQFLIGLLLILCWMVAYAMLSYWRKVKINYSTKIQLYVYFAFILPLIVVSAVTMRLVSSSNERKIEKELQNRAEQLSSGITPFLDLTADSLEGKRLLESRLLELAKSFDIDVNVYSAQGLLVASSQPEIFNNQLLSNFINPSAWLRLANDNENYLVNKEEIGKLKFNNSYLALRQPASGRLMAILNLPFFKSVDQIDRNEALVLSNILIVFVGVFILFSILSYYAVKWLTFPLAFITKTLRVTKLGVNHQLDWKADDEIGLMVNEYNQMVRNLELSRIELARTQKENAWREMAQQVAHEIKNPLTPMKLSLQKMQISVQEEDDRKRTILMLLEQVEILNQIASSFSTFAKMPTPLLEQKDVTEIVENIVGLYANYSLGEVDLKMDIRPIFVMADVALMSRILSNLILNGLQSGKENQFVQVTVTVLAENNQCILLIEDNGTGMSADTMDKVFMPFFSTKKAGSGLGLAIAKQGIEQLGGTISFTSKLGVGTKFKIALPIS
jgi:two-component system nitrogen regulation sensor histidine kinase NtrY